MRSHPTSPERWLWEQLRRRRFHDLKFRRQVPIGSYIVDFVCFEKHVIVELDGSGHDDTVQYDLTRKAWLESQGFVVLRFGSEIPIADGLKLLEVLRQRIFGE